MSKKRIKTKIIMNRVSYRIFKPEIVKVTRLEFEAAVEGPLVNNVGQCDVAINNQLDIYLECQGPPTTDFSFYVWVDSRPIITETGNGEIKGTITSNGKCIINSGYNWY
jgi:hypothetical protein